MIGESDRGSVALLVLGLATMVLVCAVLTADVVVFLAGRAQAQVAADAAALAAAPRTFSGADAFATAAATAEANGAVLIHCDCRGNATWARRSVVIAVEIPIDLAILADTTATATARAVFDPTLLHR